MTARFVDRLGKGIRGAPRDALIADITPEEVRGASYGLRQALDSVGAFVGPIIAIGLMVLLANDIRGVFWFALIPAALLGTALWGLYMGLTKGVLAAQVADTAPVRLRGTAFGLFNLVSGIAMLLASVAAGLLWDAYGAPVPFIASVPLSGERWLPLQDNQLIVAANGRVME